MPDPARRDSDACHAFALAGTGVGEGRAFLDLAAAETGALLAHLDPVLGTALDARVPSLLLDNHLDRAPADGGCEKGARYWRRAGAALFECLDTLHRASPGALDAFAHPMVRAIARYPPVTHVDARRDNTHPHNTHPHNTHRDGGRRHQLSGGCWMIRQPRALVAMSPDAFDQLFDRRALDRLADLAAVPDPVGPTDLSDPAGLAALSDTEVLITGWGCPPLTAEVLARAPRLEAVFHAAGSVKEHITRACWERGIAVTTAADANAIPVAEYTLAAVALSAKRFFEYAARYRESPGEWSPWRDRVREGIRYPHTVGLVGLSRIGRRVAEGLRGLGLTVLASDPYARPADAEALGVRLTGLDELVATSTIVSLHAPLLDQTRHLLDARRLAMLPDGATVINTARGALVDTAALTAECVSGRISAVLDVTDPEPLPADSPLYRLPNVTLTPHIAGALGGETLRMTDLALDELDRYRHGLPLRHQVHPDELARIA